jgi:hypothetical protein
LSLKSAGIWSAIRQACFLVGPSTIAGALVNIKLTGNPVNYNFTSANYNKLTGLIGSPDLSQNTTRYLDTLLNDTTDINGLDFHLFVQRFSTNYNVTSPEREYMFGSNNDGGTLGANINMYKDENGDLIYPNSYENYTFDAGGSSVCFSRLDGDVTFAKTPFGWGTYATDYADYFSGNNFLLFKTNPSSSATVDRMYRGQISFYSIGTSTNVEAMIGIIDQLKNSLVS